MKVLYPPIEPYATCYQDVGQEHRIYVEECGNRFGVPVVFLHGGPGSGCKEHHRCFFDPDVYRIVLFDQRGCGRSTPLGEIQDNTTQDLLGDLETIRRRLGIDDWIIYGGSWGATLALLYAQEHPDKTVGLILRGTFLARQRDLDWFTGDGVNRIYPEQWARLLETVPADERQNPIQAFCRRLHGRDELAQRRAAREWEAWGGTVTLGAEFDSAERDEHVSSRILCQAQIETYYALNRYFIEDNQILRNCKRIQGIPATIVHGRRDLVCPAESAYLLHQKLPESDLRILPQSGHIADGDEMIDALICATDDMAERVGR